MPYQAYRKLCNLPRIVKEGLFPFKISRVFSLKAPLLGCVI
jgi:hypothetical protein